MMHYREEDRLYCHFSCFVFARVEKKEREVGTGEKEEDERDEREMN